MTKASTPQVPAPNTQHMVTDSHENKRNRAIMSSPDLSEEEESPSSGKCPTIGRNEGVAIPTPPAITSQFNPWQYLQSTSNGTIANSVLTLERAFKITAPPLGGFPTPQLGQSVWHNVAQTLCKKWPQKDGPKVWVCTFCAQHEENAQATVAKL
ncbi:hypothetical protein BDR05DRAFT_1005034 [Suillus weaverae]|nr:hypothetical protein BDR05DRAFT_1005034 [Suillus weaverae]